MCVPVATLATQPAKFSFLRTRLHKAGVQPESPSFVDLCGEIPRNRPGVGPRQTTTVSSRYA